MELRKRARSVGVAGAATFIVALVVAHFLHPRADFPNFSPWMDYAKYTDEGWYGNAAIAYFIRGGWYVPGDFNPGVALPVWPFLEWVLFHFTGVSLAAARLLAIAIFAGNVAMTYSLVRTQTGRAASVLAAALVASNAFLYCFSRLAILEPPLVFMMLLAWLLALKLPDVRTRWAQIGMLTAIGLLLCAMVLTKTTAIVLLPSVFYLVWHARRAEPRAAWSSCGIVTLAAALPWCAYYLFVVRPRYLADYRYLFAVNVYPQPTNAVGWLMAFWYSLHGALWIDPRLAILTVVLLLLSTFFFRNVWRNPLSIACCLASGGYLFFIGFHNNMQPRYYQVVAFPLLIITVLALRELLTYKDIWRLAGGAIACVAIVYTLFVNTRETLWFAFHPQYTFVDAAENLTRYIDEHPNRNRLLLSISGSNIALVTGLPAICDDFGTLDLPERIRRYQPGWYAAWNELDMGTLDDLHTQFNLEQVASFPAYDDEDRNKLILYKLTPLVPSASKAQKPHRLPPRPLGAEAGKPPEIRRVAD